MGSSVSKSPRRRPAAEQQRSDGFISNLGVSISHRLQQLRRSAPFSRPVRLNCRLSVTKTLLPPHDRAQRTSGDGPLPALVAVFLPEFPHRSFPLHDRFQILGFIAKGSFGPILKVKDISKEKTFAVKVLPKSEILQRGVLEQSKEEVIIQRQLKHPFIHNLQDCWQTQWHLFIMCEYCSVGDLYTYWLLKGKFGEEEVRLFGAELGSALGFLHDLGIVHRDVKMENILLSDLGHLRLSDFGLSHRLKRGGRAFTICGTIEYMAPEVLSGGPYTHAADWWSLGVVLFSLVTGEFPVRPESNHCTMLSKVQAFPYLLPQTFSPALRFLLTELLCKNPAKRLCTLERFKVQTFFRGLSFDAQILLKTPVCFILDLRNHPDWAAKAMRGLSSDCFHDFDFDKTFYSSIEFSPKLANMDLNRDPEPKTHITQDLDTRQDLPEQ
ncbi:ribosomal protein S6 kinase-related protein-like isoform X2 [Genypterus blacodes]|uniref:ribosomal protein S6 kinase-related protein-like isoform X2 n=1 Tax=Genypterus blacodes TaxID=154954 RepID=UPI003F766D7D